MKCEPVCGVPANIEPMEGWEGGLLGVGIKRQYQRVSPKIAVACQSVLPHSKIVIENET